MDSYTFPGDPLHSRGSSEGPRLHTLCTHRTGTCAQSQRSLRAGTSFAPLNRVAGALWPWPQAEETRPRAGGLWTGGNIPDFKSLSASGPFWLPAEKWRERSSLGERRQSLKTSRRAALCTVRATYTSDLIERKPDGARCSSV